MLVNYYRFIGGDESYIGSTIGGLGERWRCHKKNTNPCATKYLIEKYGIENCSIELIETRECATSQERYRREGELVGACSNCVNKNKPGRTSAEYEEEMKEARLEKDRSRYLRDKEKRNAISKSYYIANRTKILTRIKERKLDQ
jgi:hypothetical protein